jgi:hypothetical protein
MKSYKRSNFINPIKSSAFNGSEDRLFKQKIPLKLGDIIKVTLNPQIEDTDIIYNGDGEECPEMDIEDVHSQTNQMLKIVRQVRKLFNNTSHFFNIVLYPDLSKTHRLHFHGFIMVDEIFNFDLTIKFFTNNFFTKGKQSNYNVVIERLGDTEEDRISWLLYCTYYYNTLNTFTPPNYLIECYGPKGADELVIINNTTTQPSKVEVYKDIVVTVSNKETPTNKLSYTPTEIYNKYNTTESEYEEHIDGEYYETGEPKKVIKQTKGKQTKLTRSGRPRKFDRINN